MGDHVHRPEQLNCWSLDSVRLNPLCVPLIAYINHSINAINKNREREQKKKKKKKKR
jgi:hypothetical protein